jgi:hypothetical protein
MNDTNMGESIEFTSNASIRKLMESYFPATKYRLKSGEMK